MQLLKLRYFQLRRDLGIWVFIIALAAFYLCYTISSVSQLYSLAFTGAVALALYSCQLNRKDRSFIAHYLDKPRWQIPINYSILLSPFFLAFVIAGNWEHALTLCSLSTIISQLRPISSVQKFPFISRIIPPEQFEWISGVRKNFYLLVLLLLIAIVLSPVKFFGLVALFLVNMVFLGFYNFYEPLLMLNPSSLTIESFLKQKINYCIKTLLLINCPLLLVNMIFNFESAWFDLCFIFSVLLLASCTIYIKYAHYRPNDMQSFKVDFIILVAGVLIPYFLPLCIYVYYSNRKKAIINLSHYLYDTHSDSGI